MANFREVVHTSSNALSMTFFGEQVIPFLIDYGWLLILPTILILVDLWFGISESRQQCKDIRFSGAGWKTLRKLMDYYTMLTLGFILGHTMPEYMGISIQEACFYCILLPGFFDISSITGHILKLHGINLSPTKFILRVLVGLVKNKSDNLGEAIENSLDDKS